MRKLHYVILFGLILFGWNSTTRPMYLTEKGIGHTEQGVGAVKQNVRLKVTDVQGGVNVDSGTISFELRNIGVMGKLRIGEKAIVADNDTPLLAASVLESAEYDGWSDYAPGEVIEAKHVPGEHEYRHDNGSFEATFAGRLDFGGGDGIEYQLTLAVSSQSDILRLSAKLTPSGDFDHRYIRSVALRLPLALQKRKRVVQAGDRGLQWNTRHWYQFYIGPTMTLMNEPDHNIWRHFAVDQDTECDYHIWRSESIATSPLTMQRGIQAPGWMAVYDEQGGVLFSYRGLAQRAPKSLRVMADDSGEALVYLWHPGLPALDIRSPQAQSVFGDEHVTDWLPFMGDLTDVRPDFQLAKYWDVDGFASDPPDLNEIPLDGINPLSPFSADSEAPMVSGGVPLPKGALNDPENVRLTHDGLDVPLQSKPAAYWPDKSIKWLLLTFPADGGAVKGASGDGDAMSFDLTRRDGSKSAYRLDYDGSAKIGMPQTALKASQSGNSVSIDTGPLQIKIAAAENWLQSVRLYGKDMLTGGGKSFVDFMRVDGTYPCATAHAQGVLDDGGFIPETIELEEAGPLRATVRLQGVTTSQEPARVIVRLEAYAGRSALRVFQSVEFLHSDPRAAFVRRMGIELPLASIEGARVTVGGQDGPVAIAKGERAGLKQHSHLGYSAWHQNAGERFPRFDEISHRSRGWLDVAGAQNGVALAMRDMWQQFPNELIADVGNGRLVAYFWPESGPLMDVRRYSNYPHLSQGESVTADSNWVKERYYGQNPFVGISRTHEILLYFHAPDVQANRIDSVVSDFQRPPLVYAGADWYLNTGVLLPQLLPGSERFSRMEANLEHCAGFWKHQQKLWGWYGIWDYGDVQHHYKSGYGSIISQEKLSELLKSASEDFSGIAVSNDDREIDYAPNYEWAFDNGRWGWTNTEGLPGLYMQNQYMRTGNRDTYFFVEAMARHVRDVDMRHDGRWYGLGTRHGVQHWSDGNHEERQTTHSEFRYHHYLGGDMRSRDFAERLYKDIYSQRYVKIHAAHSGRLQGLLTWWEMTGSDEVASILERYIPCFIVDEGLCMSPPVQFPEVKCGERDRHINDSSMFFWNFGAAHGLLEYYYLTGHEGMKNALIKVADLAIAEPKLSSFLNAVVFAARHADDPAPYQEYLRNWARESIYLVQVVPHNPEFYAGPRGVLNGSAPGSMFIMNCVTYLMTVIGSDPELSASRWDYIKRIDAEGGHPYVMPKLRWQSEYDRPELIEYLRIKHPQP